MSNSKIPERIWVSGPAARAHDVIQPGSCEHEYIRADIAESEKQAAFRAGLERAAEICRDQKLLENEHVELAENEGTDSDYFKGASWILGVVENRIRVELEKAEPNYTPRFDQAEFDVMVEKGTRAWSGVDVGLIRGDGELDRLRKLNQVLIDALTPFANAQMPIERELLGDDVFLAAGRAISGIPETSDGEIYARASAEKAGPEAVQAVERHMERVVGLADDWETARDYVLGVFEFAEIHYKDGPPREYHIAESPHHDSLGCGLTQSAAWIDAASKLGGNHG